MECYEGTTMIKTFRGLIVNDGQDTIVLHTNDGSTGYRLKKLDIIQEDPYVAQAKLVAKVYSVSQTTINGNVDFSDQALLGVSTYHDQPIAEDMSESKTIIFDNMVFNQDIYVTLKDMGVNGLSASYYIELEQIKLDINESTVATLKDIRNIKQ
jgi:hypothetical protein